MIEANGLSKTYGEKEALKDVSFSISPNEIVGLLGPNGAGKTTLMRLLTGFLQPSAGRARIQGIDVVQDPVSAQATIGYLPENAPVYGDMVVQEYLHLIADLRQVPPEKKTPLISGAIYSTGLEDYLVQPISTLSRGLRQRVGLAQAILHKPQVLILDEPTSGLDPNQIVEIRSLIKKLAKNTTVLLSTHILSEVELTCERVLIIIEGQVKTDAKLEELRAGNAAIVAIEASASDAEQSLRSIPGVTDVTKQPEHDGFRTYRVIGGDSQLCPTIFDLVKNRGWRMAELRPDRQTLESIFRNVAPGHGGA
ncbi:MAG: ATP-binding cassette domain-containing protein [Pseudomonadota bacterium]